MEKTPAWAVWRQKKATRSRRDRRLRQRIGSVWICRARSDAATRSARSQASRASRPRGAGAVSGRQHQSAAYMGRRQRPHASMARRAGSSSSRKYPTAPLPASWPKPVMTHL